MGIVTWALNEGIELLRLGFNRRREERGKERKAGRAKERARGERAKTERAGM